MHLHLTKSKDAVSSGPKHSGCRVFPKDSLAARVSAKLEEGDFRGAVRLASSDATLAPIDNSTFAALQEKHFPSHPDSIFPPLQEDFLSNSISASDEDIIKAIRSFPNGSAGGPDGLRPQHLKDMIDSSAGWPSGSPPCPYFLCGVGIGGQNTIIYHTLFFWS